MGGCALHHVRRVAILYSYNSYIILHYTIYYILYISQCIGGVLYRFALYYIYDIVH